MKPRDPFPLSSRIQTAFDEAYSPMPIPVTVTENRRFVYVNPACCAFYEKERDFFLGKTADCLVENKETLARQQETIQEFNQELSATGTSLRRFTNTVHGKKTRVFVVAFVRRIGKREFRVGIAMPERFTLMTGAIANQLVQGNIDLDGFTEQIRKTKGYCHLIRDLGKGRPLKESTAYRNERQNRKRLDKVMDLAVGYINNGRGPRPSMDTIKGLSILIGDRFSDL